MRGRGRRPDAPAHETDRAGATRRPNPPFRGPVETPFVPPWRWNDPARGAPLAPDVARYFGERLAWDFSGVRMHTDPDAGRTAQELSARAFTVGNDVVFAPGEYAPATARGQALLAHELAHVIQQDGQEPAAQPKLEVGASSSAPESAADAAARAMFDPTAEHGSSTALALRDQLRRARPVPGTVQRLATWAGDFTTDHYHTRRTGGAPEGVDIKIRFAPGPLVNATKVGLVQTARTVDTGVVAFAGDNAAEIATNKAHALTGGAAAGTLIDQLADRGNPLYATKIPGKHDTLASTPTTVAFGQHGWRFNDALGAEQKQDAWITDNPGWAPPLAANSTQTFETTALAVAGEQTGTYYGTVRWGWRTNAAGKYERLDFRLGSADVPSSTFLRAAQKWNAGTTVTGAATIDLPTTALRRFANAADVEVVSDPADPAGSLIGKLDKNVTVEVTNRGGGRPFNAGVAAADRWWMVTVTEGALAGRVGWIMNSHLAAKKIP
jgi:Domain of unknown function (DUF4157)